MPKVGLAIIAATLLVTLAGCTGANAQGGFLDKNMDSLFNKGRSLLDSRPGGQAGLSNLDIGKGLKEALSVGTSRVVRTLGAKDGFYGRPDVHIPLPGALGRVKKTLSQVGLGGMTDDLERRLNRAAETAVPKTAKLFGNAIRAMTFDDVKRIYNGPNNAATQYFKGKMTSPLRESMRPVVNRQLAEVGAVRAYDRVIGQYRNIPFVPDVKADLTNYVLGKALDGVFLYLGREEAAIRQNPAKRTTQLLKKVFGSN